MGEVKSLAKWWNSEVVVPNLSTSFCIVSGPGALPLLRNLTNLMRIWVNIGHKLMFISNIKTVVIWVLRRIKISMIILNELVDFIKVISNPAGTKYWSHRSLSAQVTVYCQEFLCVTSSISKLTFSAVYM